VFVPLSLLQGVVGQFFAALSLTLSAAVLLSLVYALLLIPVPAASWLRPHAHKDVESWVGGRYAVLLRGVLAHARLVAVGTVLVAAVGVLLYFRLETGFLPEMDEGGYVIDYVTPSGTSLAETDAMVRRIEAVLKSTPEVASFTRRTGTELGLFATEQNSGDIVVRLKPAAERERGADEIISEQRATFAETIPGVEIEFVQLLQDMLGDLAGNPEPVEVKLFGDDLPTLSAIAERVSAKLEKVEGLVDLVEPREGNPELEVRVDPTRAARAGFTADQVAGQLSAGLLGAVATAVRRGDRLVDLRVRFADRYRFDAQWLRAFPLANGTGITPLSTLADVVPVSAQAQLHREDLKQMLPITGRLEHRDLGSAIREIVTILDDEHLPVGYTYQMGGQYESQQESFRSLFAVLAVAMLLVFGLLLAQFRRVSSAAIVMSAAPLSLVGAFGLLLVTGTPLNVSSFMGLILLIGLIVKNGIILIDYADRLTAEGMPRHDALVRAGAVRLRPILMTTLCTLFGLLPLALGLGSGAELQKPLAIAVIGGLSVSTVVTLVFVPALLSLAGSREAE
jgi:multidrug efflux pump subunit AcrB